MFRKSLVLFFLFPSFVFGASQGPNYPGTGTDDASFGTTAWSNPSNITSSDDTYASLTSIGGINTHYLEGTNFNFLIPSEATILGIQVEWERKANCAAGCTQDSRVRIIKGGVVGSTEKSAAAGWQNTEAFVSFGGASDLWGTTWTAADINASNFGAAIAPIGASGGAVTSVDSVRITITYSTPIIKQGFIMEDFY